MGPCRGWNTWHLRWDNDDDDNDDKNYAVDIGFFDLVGFSLIRGIGVIPHPLPLP